MNPNPPNDVEGIIEQWLNQVNARIVNLWALEDPHGIPQHSGLTIQTNKYNISTPGLKLAISSILVPESTSGYVAGPGVFIKFFHADPILYEQMAYAVIEKLEQAETLVADTIREKLKYKKQCENRAPEILDNLRTQIAQTMITHDEILRNDAKRNKADSSNIKWLLQSKTWGPVMPPSRDGDEEKKAEKSCPYCKRPL